MNKVAESLENKNVYRVEGFTCANCAGKFENNVKSLPGVQDARVNFGASKITVFGETTVEELEKAGAFENLKVIPEKPVRVAKTEVNEEKNVFNVQGFTCANCAGKFENNVKQLPGVRDAKVNFGASKIAVYGDATIEELEKAGAFENLKVTPERTVKAATQEVKKEAKQPFYKGYVKSYC